MPVPAVEIKGRERPVTMNIDVHGTGLVSYGKHGGYRNLQGSTEDGGKVSLKEKTGNLPWTWKWAKWTWLQVNMMTLLVISR